jgi:hypothetical protein
MNDISHTLGSLRSEARDVRAVVSNLDHCTRQLIEPPAIRRPAGLTARLAACRLIAIKESGCRPTLAKQHFAADRDLAHLIELKAAVTPAMTRVAVWASELAAVTVADVAPSLLPASALAQLRAASGQDYAFFGGSVVRVPTHTPVASGGFVSEGSVIPVGALIIHDLARRGPVDFGRRRVRTLL